MHPALLREVVALPGITGATGSDDVGPVVVSAPGERDEVISGEAFPVPQVTLAAMAVLAAIAISSKQECVGDLTAEAAGNVHELDESYYGRFGKGQPFASDDVATVRFDYLGFPFDHQAQRTPDRDHCQRLKGGVQRQTPHRAVS
jgi:hypothetical protein